MVNYNSDKIKEAGEVHSRCIAIARLRRGKILGIDY